MSFIILLLGCSPEFSDYATLSTDSGTTLIDVNCDTSACSGDAVSFTLTLSEHLAWGAGGEAEFQLYRVDYALESGQIGFFADEASIVVTSGSSVSFELAVVGANQRAEVDSLTDTTLAGEATLTLAGYDPSNTSVQVSTTFPVEFDDVIGDSSDTTSDTGVN